MIYIGIDPGESGGIAALGRDPETSRPWVWAFKDQTPEDIWDIFNVIVGGSESATAVLEAVHSFPKQGVASTFKFGHHAGMLEAFLIAAMIPYEKAAPGKWQRSLGCLSKGQKNVTKQKAQELFPGLKVSHATADALLLAEFCRRIVAERGGTP